MSSSSAGTPPADYSKEHEFVVWAKYEDVAMHFNDLLMRLRSQALGALAGVVAISGFAVNFTGKPTSDSEWLILIGAISFFTLAWIALGVLDLLYYDKLLQGAVEAIIAHEGNTDGRISISSQIGTKFPRIKKLKGLPAHRIVIILFYSIVLAGLLLALGGAIYMKFSPANATTSKATEYKIEVKPVDKLNVVFESSSNPGAASTQGAGNPTAPAGAAAANKKTP